MIALCKLNARWIFKVRVEPVPDNVQSRGHGQPFEERAPVGRGRRYLQPPAEGAASDSIRQKAAHQRCKWRRIYLNSSLATASSAELKGGRIGGWAEVEPSSFRMVKVGHGRGGITNWRRKKKIFSKCISMLAIGPRELGLA